MILQVAHPQFGTIREVASAALHASGALGRPITRHPSEEASP
jgi:hypothetical protein